MRVTLIQLNWGLTCSRGSSKDTRSLSLLASSFFRSFWTRTLRLDPRSLTSRLRQMGQRRLIWRHFRMQLWQKVWSAAAGM